MRAECEGEKESGVPLGSVQGSADSPAPPATPQVAEPLITSPADAGSSLPAAAAAPDGLPRIEQSGKTMVSFCGYFMADETSMHMACNGVSAPQPLRGSARHTAEHAQQYFHSSEQTFHSFEVWQGMGCECLESPRALKHCPITRALSAPQWTAARRPLRLGRIVRSRHGPGPRWNAPSVSARRPSANAAAAEAPAAEAERPAKKGTPMRGKLRG